MDRDMDRILNRKEAALFLARAGFPLAPNTLAKMAVRGGGPPFYRWGRRVAYRSGDLLAWAQDRLSGPLTSTSVVVDREDRR